jgi:hypothetical protein
MQNVLVCDIIHKNEKDTSQIDIHAVVWNKEINDPIKNYKCMHRICMS